MAMVIKYKLMPISINAYVPNVSTLLQKSEKAVEKALETVPTQEEIEEKVEKPTEEAVKDPFTHRGC